MNEIVNNIADFLLLSALIPNVVFAVRYWLFSPVEKSREGINLLAQKIALSSLIVVWLASLFIGADYPGRPFVRLIIFAAVSYFFWVEMVQLWQLQRLYPWTRYEWMKKLLNRP